MTEPLTTTVPKRAESPAPTEQRVSTLVGDRLCIGCGYNLAGQAVLREPSITC